VNDYIVVVAVVGIMVRQQVLRAIRVEHSNLVERAAKTICLPVAKVPIIPVIVVVVAAVTKRYS
jgi:hypothetical protein